MSCENSGNMGSKRGRRCTVELDMFDVSTTILNVSLSIVDGG